MTSLVKICKKTIKILKNLRGKEQKIAILGHIRDEKRRIFFSKQIAKNNPLKPHFERILELGIFKTLELKSRFGISAKLAKNFSIDSDNPKNTPYFRLSEETVQALMGLTKTQLDLYWVLLLRSYGGGQRKKLLETGEIRMSLFDLRGYLNCTGTYLGRNRSFRHKRIRKPLEALERNGLLKVFSDPPPQINRYGIKLKTDIFDRLPRPGNRIRKRGDYRFRLSDDQRKSYDLLLMNGVYPSVCAEISRSLGSQEIQKELVGPPKNPGNLCYRLRLAAAIKRERANNVKKAAENSAAERAFVGNKDLQNLLKNL